MTAYWKFLLDGGVGPFSGFDWASWGLGRQLRVEAGEAVACRSGVHACRLADLPYWLGAELWEVELHGDVRVTSTKVVAAGGTLRRRVEAWDDAMARELAQACARRALHHAAAELRSAGLDEPADALSEAPATALETAWIEPALADAERAVAGHRAAGRCTALVGYARDAVEGVGALPVATLAYIAARAADRRSTVDPDAGDDPYLGERAWQAQWLADRLSLSTR